MQLIGELEGLLKEIADLRAYKVEQDKIVKSLERKLDQAEKALRKQREKVATLEARPSVVDGLDEDWLWRQDATVTFKTRFGGGRTVTIDGRGKRVRKSGKENEALLRVALEEASGRTRGRPAAQAQDPA